MGPSVCLGGGGGGGGRWATEVCVGVCVFVRDCARCRLQLPPNSKRHHQARSPYLLLLLLYLPPSSALIPKVNLFTVILKGELFAVIVRTDEGQALRGGPARPWRVGPLSDAALRN